MPGALLRSDSLCAAYPAGHHHNASGENERQPGRRNADFHPAYTKRARDEGPRPAVQFNCGRHKERYRLMAALWTLPPAPMRYRTGARSYESQLAVMLDNVLGSFRPGNPHPGLPEPYLHTLEKLQEYDQI